MARERGRPAAHRLQIPATPQTQLATALAWLALVSRGRLSDDIIGSALEHQRHANPEPAVLIAAAVQYLVSGSDTAPDRINRFWHIADQISARERARYLNLKEEDLL